MKVLQDIIAHKRKEVNEKKELIPVKLLEKSIFFSSTCVSLKKYLKRGDKSGIIAEIKRQSPSNPIINPSVSIERTSIGYMQAGASALSVLTDQNFFGGSNEDLTVARKFNYCPILRKDFIIDEYQIIESKSAGADAILLIAAVLSQEEIKKYSELAHSLGLEVLLEIHSADELSHSEPDQADILGVNNRDLKTMTVNISNSIDIFESLPDGVVKISESGIKTAEDAATLRKKGYDGFLIGELFMKHSRPEKACMKFVEQLKELEKERV